MTARTEQEARVKIFLAGRIAVEAEGVVIDERHLPGRQGRLLFAYLVAEHGRPVPRDKLADVLWGAAPPATWDKALSVLVSKLRVVLAETGLDGASALTAAFGCYQLDLPEGAWVDVLAAESAAKDAEGFLETDELESARVAAALAESVTRHPFLPGDDGPWVDEKRRELAEVRARALGALAEASLRTDKAAEAVRWAGLTVDAEPFRESGYRRLMRAHVAAGNRGEALQVYERCRQVLAEELGAYPSPETDSIYRSLLEAPSGRAAAETPDVTSAPGGAPPSASRGNRPALRATALVGLVALVAAGTAIVVAATRGHGSRTPSGVALVVPSSPTCCDDPSAAYRDATERWKTEGDTSPQVLPIPLNKPLSARVRKTVGNVGLVLLAGESVAGKFVHEFARDPDTRFVVLDPDPVNLSLANAVGSHPNTSDGFFIEGPGARLAGYVGALMEKQSSGKRPVVLSQILVNRSVSANVITNFRTGARAAVPGVTVVTSWAGKSSPPKRCEAIANAQIEQGSRVVYADAGACSAGALSAVQGHHGVWEIEAVQNPSSPFGPRILGHTVKNIPLEVDWVIRNYLAGTLPRRHHWDVGIGRRMVDFVPAEVVPAGILAAYRGYRNHWMPHWRTLEKPPLK